jgi:hypothetical protein
LPDGCMNVRHFGLLHTSGAVPLATSRLMIGQGPPSEDQPPQHEPPQPSVIRGPTCGGPMHVVMRLWTSPQAFVDTRCAAGRCPDECGAIRCGPPTAPVRPQSGIRAHKAADAGSATVFQRLAAASRGSTAAPMARPHHGVRHTLPSHA